MSRLLAAIKYLSRDTRDSQQVCGVTPGREGATNGGTEVGAVGLQYHADCDSVV